MSWYVQIRLLKRDGITFFPVKVSTNRNDSVVHSLTDIQLSGQVRDWASSLQARDVKFVKLVYLFPSNFRVDIPMPTLTANFSMLGYMYADALVYWFHPSLAYQLTRHLPIALVGGHFCISHRKVQVSYNLITYFLPPRPCSLLWRLRLSCKSLSDRIGYDAFTFLRERDLYLGLLNFVLFFHSIFVLIS